MSLPIGIPAIKNGTTAQPVKIPAGNLDLSEQAQAIASLGTSVSTLESASNTQTQSISDLETASNIHTQSIADLESNVSDLESESSARAQTLGDLEGQIASMSSEIDSLDLSVFLEKTFVPVDFAGGRLVVNLSFEPDGDSYRVTQSYVDPKDGSTMNPYQVLPLATADNPGVMSAAQAQAITDLQSDVATLDTTSNTQTQSITDLETSVSDLETTSNEQTQSIEDLEGQVTEMATEIDALDLSVFLEKTFVPVDFAGGRLVVNLSFEPDGDSYRVTQSYVDPKDGSTMNPYQVLPLATADNPGVMSAAQAQSIADLETRVAALEALNA